MPHSSSLDKFCGGIIENHPFGELKVGDSASVTRTVTIDDLRLFAAATGDANPTMLDPEFADSSIYREVVAHGMWSGAMLVNLAPPNPYSAAALAVWRQGHFLNFNGLTRWIATLWPFLTLPFLMLSARRH